MFGDEFGDESVTKFDDEFCESPKLVMSLVTNLVINLVNHRLTNQGIMSPLVIKKGSMVAMLPDTQGPARHFFEK